MRTYSTKSEANQANAQLSTGPKTAEGKRIASHNALKTGLTGRTILLPTDDVAAFEAHMAEIDKRYAPTSAEEKQIAENIGHIEWRLARIPTLETGILAIGREQFADAHADQPLDVRRIMIEAQVHLAYAKQLANLSLQETRLQRQHDKQRARLAELRKEREKIVDIHTSEAIDLYKKCEKEGRPFPLTHLREIGFEFSLSKLKHFFLYSGAKRNGSLTPTLDALKAAQTHKFRFE